MTEEKEIKTNSTNTVKFSIPEILTLLDLFPSNCIKVYLTVLQYGNQQTASDICSKTNIDRRNFAKTIKPLINANLIKVDNGLYYASKNIEEVPKIISFEPKIKTPPSEQKTIPASNFNTKTVTEPSIKLKAISIDDDFWF